MWKLGFGTFVVLWAIGFAARRWLRRRGGPRLGTRHGVTSFSSTGSVALVQLVGTVASTEVATSPLTRTPCLAWATTVYEMTAQPVVAPLVHHASRVVPLMLTDESGSAMLRVEMPVRLVARVTRRVLRREAADGEDGLALLERLGVPPPDATSPITGYRIEESVLVPGARVGVVGLVRVEASPNDGSYRDAGARLRVSPGPEGHVLVTDDVASLA